MSHRRERLAVLRADGAADRVLVVLPFHDRLFRYRKVESLACARVEHANATTHLARYQRRHCLRRSAKALSPFDSAEYPAGR